MLELIMNFSLPSASLSTDSHGWKTIRLFILSTLFQKASTILYWCLKRMQYAYCTTAKFSQEDPSYEWILNLLTQEKIWHRSRTFRIRQKSNKRRWAIEYNEGNAVYVPYYEEAQLFRWNGYWVEVEKGFEDDSDPISLHSKGILSVSIYTLNLNVLSDFVESAQTHYKEATKNSVTVHIAFHSRSRMRWKTQRMNARRPLHSVVLKEGLVDSLVTDVREFLDSEEWYRHIGIPYRRGYLLHGPPGTGKTSTIYALAGELGLEIYTIPLSASFVDDYFLEKAVSSMSRNSILLIEDIDCAFSSREESMDWEVNSVLEVAVPGRVRMRRKATVTLSGLLNVIDGIGSDEGRVFFATTNYFDKLDSALIRPGRIDLKIQYQLATKLQASALFARFYGRAGKHGSSSSTEIGTTVHDVEIHAAQFAACIPDHEFSMAELQGFLLSCKDDPGRAIDKVDGWMQQVHAERAIVGQEKRKNRW